MYSKQLQLHIICNPDMGPKMESIFSLFMYEAQFKRIKEWIGSVGSHWNKLTNKGFDINIRQFEPLDAMLYIYIYVKFIVITILNKD